jgi:hypothetical protein
MLLEGDPGNSGKFYKEGEVVISGEARQKSGNQPSPTLPWPQYVHTHDIMTNLEKDGVSVRGNGVPDYDDIP